MQITMWSIFIIFADHFLLCVYQQQFNHALIVIILVKKRDCFPGVSFTLKYFYFALTCAKYFSNYTLPNSFERMFNLHGHISQWTCAFLFLIFISCVWNYCFDKSSHYSFAGKKKIIFHPIILFTLHFKWEKPQTNQRPWFAA